MSSIFDQHFLQSAAPGLMDQFGESVVYLPRNGADGRPISAIVERGALEVMSEIGDHATPAIVVQVFNDSATGISSQEINTGGDKIKVALRVGQTPTDRMVVEVLSDSGGMLRLAVK